MRARLGTRGRPSTGKGTRLINSLVRPRSWGTPDAIRAERPGAVRRAAGQHDWARACEGRQRALQKEMRAAVAGVVSARKSRISDRQDFPLGLRLTGGQRHHRTQAPGPSLGEAWSGPSVPSDRRPRL